MLKLSKQELDKIHRSGAAMAELLFPPQYDSAEDLKNYSPTNFVFGSDGKRLAGRILSSDLTKGAPSPGVFAYFIPLLLSASLCVFAALVSIFYFAAVPFVDIFHNGALEISKSGILEGILGSLWGVTSYFMLMNAILSVPMLGVALFAYLWISEQETSEDVTRVFVYATLAALLLVIMPGTGILLAFLATSYGAFKMFSGKSAGLLVVLLSPFLGALLCLVVGLAGIFGVRIYMWALDKARHEAIRNTVHDTKGDSMIKDIQAMEETRKAQAALSLDDKSPFIPVGKSLGVLRRDGDVLTPDPEATIGLTFEDLSTHMMVTGSSGRGKTVFVLRPLVRSWINANYGGVLVMDPGKSELPYDLEDVLDKVLTPENSYINLIDGLRPEPAANTFFAVLKGDGAIWDSSAEKDIRQALFVLDYASRFPHLKAVAPYCINSIYSFCLRKDFREAVLKSLPPPEEEYMKMAFDYWLVQVPSIPEETRGSTEFTVRDWMASFVLHSKMSKWIGEESDLNISEYVSKGGCLGFEANEAKYGAGGKMAMALIRAAFYDRMNSRGSNWKKKEGERPILLAVDECAAGITTTDMDFVRVARSYGCTMLFAVQDYESIKFKIAPQTSSPDDAMKSFVNQFSSSITLKTSMDTLRFDCERAGRRLRWSQSKESGESAQLMQSVLAEQSSGFDGQNRGYIGEVAKSITGVFSSTKKALSMSVQSDNAEQNMMNREATMKGSYDIKCTIEPEEAMIYLERPFTALVNLNRAKAPRREIVDLSMWHPKNLAKQQVQKIAA